MEEKDSRSRLQNLG